MATLTAAAREAKNLAARNRRAAAKLAAEQAAAASAVEKQNPIATAKEVEMEITFVNTAKETEAHAAGCSHIKRGTESPAWQVAYTSTFSTRVEAYMDFNGDFYEQGGKDDCHHIAFKPCTKNLPNGVWPAEYGL